MVCIKFIYELLSTPGDLQESSFIFPNRIIPNSSSLAIQGGTIKLLS